MSCCKTVSKSPWATTSPPKLPASGPMSIIASAARMISSSCSTTITVFPKRLSCWRIFIKRSLSREWRPILGSSKMYIEPTKLLPREVAKLMRCDSPPERVFDLRLRLKYPSPTSWINERRVLISINNLLAMAFSCSVKEVSAKNDATSSKGRWTKSDKLFPLIFT